MQPNHTIIGWLVKSKTHTAQQMCFQPHSVCSEPCEVNAKLISIILQERHFIVFPNHFLS